MFNFLSNLISTSSAGHGTSFLSVGLGSMVFNIVRDLAVTVYNFFLGIIWFVLKWFLGALDAMQHIVTSFLGIDTTGPIYSPDGVLIAEGNSISVGELVTEFKSIFSGGNSYFDILMSIFRALTVVAIILMIIFAIVAMVMQEWKLTEQQKYTPDKNDKMKIIRNVGVNILTILLMPLTFYFVIIGTNSILTSFYRAIGNEAGVSLGGQVLASSTYDANRYRTYANANKRIPITIEVYDPDTVSNKTIKDNKTQQQLRAIAGAFANNSFLSFEKSTVFGGGTQYSGSTFRYNNKTFAYGAKPTTPDPSVDEYLGTVFENFICTREQYYVMADFIDYCQMHNMEYYIKAIEEPDIDWKYVDSAVVTLDEPQPNGTTLGEVNLTINYRDAEDVTNEQITANNDPSTVTNEPVNPSDDNGKDDSYSLTFTTEKQVVSAVSDALTTISTLLGLGDNPAMYNTMERDDSGDYTNLVSWANEKAILKLSPSFNINDSVNWTKTDQMIIYEYFKYSSNNTLENYTLDDLKTTGAEIDVQILTYRNIGSYFDNGSYYCIKLNGSYYKVKPSETLKDFYGNPYYEFIEPTSNYFKNGAIQIEKLDTKTNIKLSNGFNINNNSNWTVSDTILVYEYFSNLSLSNELRRYKFTDFYSDKSGVDFTVFKIKDEFSGAGSDKYYIYINNTYYQVDSSTKLLPQTTNDFTTNSGSNFMVDADDKSTVTYNFQISFSNAERYGLPVNTSGQLDSSKVFTTTLSGYSEVEESDVFFTKYSNVNLKLSNTFDFTNGETWTYRDYLVFYIYAISNHNSNIEMLKLNGIQGMIVKTSANKYYLKTTDLLTPGTGGGDSYFLDLDTFDKLSDLRIQLTLENSIYEDMRLDMTGVGVQESFYITDKIYRAKTEIKLFELSESFDEYDPQSWTIGDYYLTYFSNKGIIRANLDAIRSMGYSALVYEIEDGGGSYKLYRFGGNEDNYHYINSAELPTYVVNEETNTIGQHTIDSFFETKLMAYVFSQYLTGSSETKVLSYSENEFLSQVYQNYTGFVYQVDADLTSSSSLVKKLVEEKFSAITTEIANYTYSNASFKSDDPSTWTNMDIALYAITGLNRGTYTSRLIKLDTGKIYFLVENYLLDLSTGSKFASSVSSVSSLSSPGIKFSSDVATEYDNIWNTKLAGMVVSSVGATTLLSNSEFEYETKIDLSPAATFSLNTQYTELDLIIKRLGIGRAATDAAPAKYKSYVYKTANGDTYIKLNNHYIRVYAFAYGSVTYTQGNAITLTSPTGVVTYSGTNYKSTKYVAGNGIGTYKYLDAFIFDQIGEIKEVEYKIYTIGGQSYIYVNNIFVNISGLTGAINLSGINTTSGSANYDADIARNEKYISYLYETYYAKYQLASRPSYAPATKVEVSTATNGYVINLDNIDLVNNGQWTPLGIILYANGLLESNKKFSESIFAEVPAGAAPGSEAVATARITAETYRSGDSSKLYLFVHKTLVETGETFDYYFDITNLVKDTTLACPTLARVEMQLRLATCIYDAGNQTVSKRAVHSSIFDHATDVTEAKTEYVDAHKYSADLTFTRATPSSWTWLELLYYYYNGSAATGNVYIEKFLANDKEFLVFNKGAEKHFFELTTDLTTAFTQSTEKTAQYSIDAQIVSLVVEMKSQKTSDIKYREVTATGGLKFYYFTDVYGEYYAVYGLSADTKQSLEEYKVWTKVITGGTVQKDLLTNTQAAADGTYTSSSEVSFTYVSKQLDELDTWTLLDFVLSYIKSSATPQYISSKVYNFGGSNFFKFTDQYINMFDDEVVDFEANTSGLAPYYGQLTSSRTLIDLMTGDILLKYTTPAVKTIVDAAETKLNATIDTSEVIRFSEGFDLADYSTWTITDYIMYYVFTNGNYINQDTFDPDNPDYNFSIAFTYSYTPSYEEVGTKYSNMTYLDLGIYHATNALPDKTKTYKFNVYEHTVSGNKTLYLKISDAMYVEFSDYIKLNTSERTIESAIIPGYVEDLDDSFAEYYTESDPTIPIQYTTSLTSPVLYETQLSAINLQTFVNIGGLYANVYNLTKPDEFGDTKLYKIVDFRNSLTPIHSVVYYNYEVLMELYNKKVGSNIKTKTVGKVDVGIVSNSTATLKTSLSEYELRITYDEVVPDFDFENYYYYNLDFEKLAESKLMEVDEQLKQNIKKGIYNITGTFNLKLDAGGGTNKDQPKSIAQLLDTNFGDWTPRDLIIMLEFSNDVRHNIFKGMDFKEVYTDDYFIDVYSYDGKNAIYINGNFYNITGFTTLNATSGIYELNSDTTMIHYKDAGNNDKTVSVGSIVKAGNINEYAFRTLVETKKFALNSNYSGYYSIVDDEATISFTTTISGKNVTVVKQINTNIAKVSYQLNLLNYESYRVEPYIKKVSWVQKLMTDMQVYYPDLNWSTLLATDGWLDTLGDYVSAYTTGLYVSDDNSSNVTAAGIVLAEFFMSKATPVYESYANFEYSSMFDEDTVDALMRALMGEDNFKALSLEAELFMDFFNSTYAPILDDLSAEFGEAINGDSLRMCVYKSYLATILLSSDIGEYLYTIATRVYSEYTICEYLAGAGGDYGGYYSYVNKLPDENGERVDSYNYGSFAELVQYENEFCGNATPTFSFNFRKAFSKYFSLDEFKRSAKYLTMIQRASPEAVAAFEACTSNADVFDPVGAHPGAAQKYDEIYHQIVYYLVDKLNEDYESIYDTGNAIGEQGYIVNKEGEVTSTNKEYVYCYMLHVYWSIDQEVTFLPFYVDLYRQYLEGKITRWEIIDDACIEGCDQYISKYLTYEVKLQLYKTMSFASLLKLLMPSVALNDEDADNSGLLGIIKSVIQSIGDNGVGETLGNLTIVIPAIHGKLMLKGGTVEESINYVYANSLMLYFQMFVSEDSAINDFLKQAIELIGSFFGASIDMSSPEAVGNAWQKILDYDMHLDKVIAELQALTDIAVGEKTKNNTVKNFDTPIIEVVANAFKDVKLQIEKYIATQKILDQIQKRSITFTLAQFGANYVSSGFKFAVKNKDYTFRSTVDSSRLAEYVYGGAFLESVGVGAQYTEPTFEGIVRASKVYDSKDKVVKTELNCWSQLRGFAAELADYTATIYFLTNLGDLSPNYENVVKMTDTNTYNNGSGATTTTQESVIIDKFLESDVSPGIIATLVIPSETAEALDVMPEETKDYIEKVNDITKGIDAFTPAEIRAAIRGYMQTIGSTDYTNIPDSKRFYQGNSSQVIHQIFQKLMNYMLVTDAGDGSDIRYINYEGMTFEGLKREIIRSVIENKQYKDEDSAANAARYLALFDIVNTQFEYEVNGTKTGRMIRQNQLNVAQQESGSTTVSISAEFTSSYQTEQSVLTLCGLENKPTTSIVEKEIAGEARKQFDEAVGDIFIICTYNPRTNLYVPILASNGNEYSSTPYDNYKNLNYTTIYSDYYSDGAYPIIAKGIITADGYPTAIKKYAAPIAITQRTAFGNTETVYNQVAFYRTNLGANTGLGADYAAMSQAVNKVTTKNYTSFTMSTSYTSGIGSGTTYTGKDNIKSSFQSDVKANYIQIKSEYLISQMDDYGSISVLEDFHNFYTFGGQSLMLCIMALMILFPIIFDASLGVMRRLFDLLFLFIASPMMVAMKATSEDNKSKSFDIWVRDMQGALFGCMGYIIGFSSYFLLFGAIYNIDSFISVATYHSIAKIGGLGNFITIGLLNSVLRCCWVLAGVYIIKTIPKALLPIVTGNKLTSEDSPLGKGGSMSQKIKQLTSDIQKIASKVGAVMSGKALMQLKDMAIQTAKDTVPGMKLISNLGIGRSLKAKREGKEIEKALVEYGVDKDTASKAGKSVSGKKKEELDKKKKKQEDNAKDFKKTFELP